MKEKIITLLATVQREGTQDLINYLESSDYFTAPASTKYHSCHLGGLAEHSLNVYKLLEHKNKVYKLEIPQDSIILVSLMHDLCKVAFYQEGGEPCSKAQYDYLCSLWTQKNGAIKEKPEELLKYLEDGQFKRSVPSASATILIDWLKNKPGEPFPEIPVVYSVKDNFPVGHAEKSIIILQKYIKLTDFEIMAIRWHMGLPEEYEARQAYNHALELYPAIMTVCTADMESSYILEGRKTDDI